MVLRWNVVNRYSRRVCQIHSAHCAVIAVVCGLCAAASHAGVDVRPAPAVDAKLRGDLRVDAWNIAAESLSAQLPAFNKSFPDVHVDVNMTGALLPARLMLALSAGVGAPDVTVLQYQDVLRFAATGQLSDLTQLATRYRDVFPENVWKDCTHDGRVYGIPWDLAPCAVFYKRDIFEHYNIDPATIRTWDDYVAAGQTILAGSNGKTRMLFHPTSTAEFLFEILLRQSGGQVFDGAGSVAVNSPQSRRVLALLRRFSETGIGANAPHWTPPFYASFKSDAIATYPMAVWFGRFIQDYAPHDAGRWGVFPLPVFTGDALRATTYGGSALVIPNQSHQQEAARAYVEFMVCNRTMQLAHYQHFDLFPAMSATYTDPFFDEPVAYFGNQPVRRLFANEVSKIPSFNRTPDWEETRHYIRQSLSRWLNSKDTADTFLAELERKLAARLGRSISPQSNAMVGRK